MHRHLKFGLALVAAGLVFTTPATAGDDVALKEQVKQLQAQVDALSARQAANVASEIESYLAENAAWHGAQGGDLKGVKISSRVTIVNQNTLGNDPNDRSVVSGDVDLDFDFKVTDNLDLFVYLTANTHDDNGFEADFGQDEHGAFGDSFYEEALLTGPGSSAASFFSPIGLGTLSGMTDGIGVNGTQSVRPEEGYVLVREAGITHRIPVGDNWLHWQAGAIDPRDRFLQNAFADNENTQFINNLFDDSPSVQWLSDATGRMYLGWYGWISFGDNQQYTISWGWFNTPGQFFNNGQFYAQFGWKGQVNGREMNLRIMGTIDEYFVDSLRDGSAGGGVSWDWWVTDSIGLFIRIATNGGDVNPVELDASIGAQFNGLVGSRPDDKVGVAVGFISTNNTVITLPEDTEVTVEVYYDFSVEDGKMHITPHLMYVSNQGGTLGWIDDSLFILGLRIFVPF
jgi:hypothetical protein